MRYDLRYDAPLPVLGWGQVMKGIEREFVLEIVTPFINDKNLGSAKMMKPLLDEKLSPYTAHFFNPLSYLKKIEKLENPVFWVITTKPLSNYEKEYPREISWGFISPKNTADNVNHEVIIDWRGSLRWTGKVWLVDPYENADAIILGTIMDEQYNSQEHFNNLWENRKSNGFWTRHNFGYPKVNQRNPRNTQYKYNSKMLVVPLGTQEFTDTLGLLNWEW